FRVSCRDVAWFGPWFDDQPTGEIDTAALVLSDGHTNVDRSCLLRLTRWTRCYHSTGALRCLIDLHREARARVIKGRKSAGPCSAPRSIPGDESCSHCLASDCDGAGY